MTSSSAKRSWDSGEDMTKSIPPLIICILRRADQLLTANIPHAEVMRHLEYRYRRTGDGVADMEGCHLITGHDSKRWIKKISG